LLDFNTVFLSISIVALLTAPLALGFVYSSSMSNYLVLKYMFPWPAYDLKPPWLSAMAQAESSAVLLKAHELTADRKYLNTAKKLLNVLFIEVQDGGVTYKTEKDGWWYELFAQNRSQDEPRVLNGMLITVLAVHDYYKRTNDSDAKYLFDKGVLALRKNLPKYDYSGTYTFYDACCGNLTPVDYHEIVISTLSQLYNITNEQIFKFYYDNWKNYIVPEKLLQVEPQPPPRLMYDNGIPILDYNYVAGIYVGLQRNPVTIAHYADDYYESYKNTRDDRFREDFLNCANWIVENSVPLAS
jgi:hypothetical protein